MISNIIKDRFKKYAVQNADEEEDALRRKVSMAILSRSYVPAWELDKQHHACFKYKNSG